MESQTPPPRPLQSPITACLLRSALAASIGTSFPWGYSIGVMTGPSAFIQSFYNQSYYDQYGYYLSDGHNLWLWAFTISSFCIGGSVGTFVGNHLADAIGRRSTLFVTSAITVIASCLMGISQAVNVYQLVVIGRFVIGVSAGLGMVASPLYLAEISPVEFRGGVAAIHQLGISSGILVSQVLGLYPLYSQELWPVLLSIIGVFSLLGCSVLAFCPQSPRWLLITSSNANQQRNGTVGESTQLIDGNRYKARQSLIRLRGTEDVEDEIEEMLYERTQELSDKVVGILEVITLKNPDWKWPLIISIVIHTSQQLAGINAVMYYTTEIFSEARLSESVVKIATFGTGVVIFVTDIMTLFLVDKLGRRFFLLVPYSVMTFATAFLALSMTANGDVWSYFSILSVYLFLLGFSPGPGAMTSVVVPEIWTQGPRPAAISIAGQFNWWSNFAVGIAFPFMLDGLEGYSFLIFSAILAMVVLFVYFYVPETKNKTFAEISSYFKKNSNDRIPLSSL